MGNCIMKTRYTKKDVTELVRKSFFSTGKTMSIEEAKELIRSKAYNEGVMLSKWFDKQE